MGEVIQKVACELGRLLNESIEEFITEQLKLTEKDEAIIKKCLTFVHQAENPFRYDLYFSDGVESTLVASWEIELGRLLLKHSPIKTDIVRILLNRMKGGE